ncbi:hypothetical protein N7467_012047 [Penicillium canescens]|nr:hypothetical protein N7467_012047 [Penicillium canescens]
MQRTIFTDNEMQVARERRVKYLGTVKVNIAEIEFEPPLPQDLDLDNLERLRGIFRKQGCRRFEVNHFIPAIVSQDAFEAAVLRAQIRSHDLLNSGEQIPTLKFEKGQLKALHGRHRLQVGSELLAPVERWWTVDLYLNHIGKDLRQSLVEEYSNEKAPTDGEIYWRVRQYEAEQNENSRQRWFVRLSKNKQMRLDQLDNKRNRRLRQGLDKLLQIRGLWLDGLRISMFHRVIAAAVNEEVLHYLDHILESYLYFVNGDYNSLKKIGPDAVSCLQLRAPGNSRKDANLIRGIVLGGKRSRDLRKAREREYGASSKGPHVTSIWETMKRMFIPSSEGERECFIQTTARCFRRTRFEDIKSFELGYRQLWLYAMRNYFLMPRVSEKNDELLAKPDRAKADKKILYEMAELAHRLGFESTEIQELLAQCPDRQIALAALLQARKPDRYEYHPHQLESLVTKVVECFSAAVEQDERPSILLADSSVEARARCGMPQLKTHKQDSPFLFLDNIHTVSLPVFDNITTFFVRRCVYLAFFGKLHDFQLLDGQGHIGDVDQDMHRDTPLPEGQEDRELPVEDLSLPGGIPDTSVSDPSPLGVTGTRSWSARPEGLPDIPQIQSSASTNHEPASNQGDRYVTYSPSIYSSKISDDSGPPTVIGTEEQPHHTQLDLLAAAQIGLAKINDRSLVSPSIPPSSGEAIDIYFCSFEHGTWAQADIFRAVSASDTSRVERTAKKYIRKEFSLYDKDLQSLSPAQCFRAASEGNQTIYIISYDQNKALQRLGSVERHKKLSSAMSTVASYEGNGPLRPIIQDIVEESEEI